MRVRKGIMQHQPGRSGRTLPTSCTNLLSEVILLLHLQGVLGFIYRAYGGEFRVGDP